MLYRKLLFPLLASLDAETSHHLVLNLLRRSQLVAPVLAPLMSVRAPVPAFGLTFPNAIGLAAGFDKNALAVRGLAALGFGHIEIGTVTPRPQPGRERPRLFRLKEDQALINSLGFPSQGMEAVARRLERLTHRDFILGVNVGPNAGSVGVDDFVRAAQRLAPLADYLTVNVSSPNTAGLRDMQASRALADLLSGVTAVVSAPVLVKIAPDLNEQRLCAMLEVIQAHRVAGVIATNTTVARPPQLRSPHAAEAGGLSGRPLAERSTEIIRLIAHHTHGQLPIIGAGGIATPADAQAKLAAGATLLQIYTGFIYEGPFLPRRLARGVSIHEGVYA